MQPDTYHRIIVEWQPGDVPAAPAPSQSAPDRLAQAAVEVVAESQVDAEQRSAPLREALATAVEVVKRATCAPSGPARSSTSRLSQR